MYISLSAVRSKREQVTGGLVNELLGDAELFHGVDDMCAHEVELFVADASALVSGLHVLAVILRWAAEGECEESLLHGLLVVLVGLAEEVGQLGVGEDLSVHAIDDGGNSGLATKSLVKGCHLFDKLFFV